MAKPSTASKELLRALREVELFGAASSEQLAAFAEAGQVRQLGPGDVLFSPGNPADHIHLILDGVIEITRSTPDHPEPVPVAYLTEGELIGDMALFTQSARRSGARVPEAATVWSLTTTVFDVLSADMPGFGMSIARMFAHRLEDFIKHMRRQQARRKELSGHLRFFDMPTVVQTLVSSNQSGILTIVDGSGVTFAEVLIMDGQIERARCGDLDGEEAFYEIFVGPEDGQFHFRTVAVPDPDATSMLPIGLTAMNLLMEAMRLVDELPEVTAGLPDPDKALEATVGPEDLEWDDEATRSVAERIVTEMVTPQPVRDLIGKIPVSTFVVYKVAAQLHETVQIA